MTASCVVDESTIKYLKERLHLLDSSRIQIIESILGITKSIKELKERIPAGHINKTESISVKIEELENDLSVSSYSIEETRMIEKHIDTLKRELLVIKQQSILEEELVMLRKKRQALYGRLTELRKEITEIDAAICVAWVIIYSRRQGRDLTPDEVSSEMVPMTAKQFIRLNRRPLTSRLEMRFCVKMTYTRSLSSCIIYGASSSLPLFIDWVKDGLSWNITSLAYNPLEVAILLYRNCKYLHEIENDTLTLFFINNENKHISIQGGQEARRKAITNYQSLFSSMQTIPLSDGSFSRLASKSKSYFKSLKEKSNCYFYLDFNKHHLHVYGNQKELETTKKLLDVFLPSLETMERRIILKETNVVPFLIGEKGKNARDMTSSTGCVCSFSSKNETPSIVLRGCQLEVEAGEQWLDKQLALYGELNQERALPELGIALLLNNRGKELRRIEEASSVQLVVNKESNTITIRGREKMQVQEAQSMLTELFHAITSSVYEVPNEVRSEMIGRKGDHINSLRKRFRVSLQLNETELKCEGLKSNVNEFNEFMNQWISLHSVKTITQSKDLIGQLVIGKQGCRVKQLEKEFHLRVYQKEDGGNSHISLVGEAKNVSACFDQLKAEIEEYHSKHFSCQFSSEQWVWCSDLSRTAINTIREKHQHCSITVFASSGIIRCEGDPAEITQLKEHFQGIQEREKEKRVFEISIPREHCGLVIGKNGNTIRELETQFNVMMKVKQEEGKITLWCDETKWNTISESIHNLIEEKAIITRKVTIPSSQRQLLFVDKCRQIQWIQSHYSVQVKLPQGQEQPLVIQGNRGNCDKAEHDIQSLLTGVFSYHYHYSSQLLNKLIATPSFHMERIALANHCNIQYDTFGNVSIRGNYDGIHKAHSQLFSQLCSHYPTQYQEIAITAGVAYYLMNNKTSLAMESPVCSVHVEPAEKKVYVFGNPKEVEKRVQDIEKQIAVLSSENVIISVEKDLIPFVIGTKGKRIKETEKESNARLTVMNSSSEIYICGAKEEVEKANSIILAQIHSYKDLNCTLETTSSLLNEFMEEYGSLLKGWEEENSCTLRIDKKLNRIHIHGLRKENVEDMKFVIENMFETVEMDREKEINDSDKEETVNDAKQQIDLLLGLA